MPKAMPPCGGGAVGERVEQEAELAAGPPLGQPDHVEDPLLHLRRWIRIEPPPISEPLQHDVVGVAKSLTRDRVEVSAYSSARCREGVVDRPSSPGRLPRRRSRPLEHRRVDHPDELPRDVVDQAGAARRPRAARPRAGHGRLDRPGSEEDAVTRVSPGVLHEACPLVLGEVLGDRSAELAVSADEDVRKSLGAALSGPSPATRRAPCAAASRRRA